MTKGKKKERAKGHGVEYWRGEVEGLKESGLTVAEYSRERGVSGDGLYKWRQRIEGGNKEGEEVRGKKFVEVGVSEERNVKESEERYEIYIKEGRTHILIGTRFNIERVKELIEVIRGERCR